MYQIFGLCVLLSLFLTVNGVGLLILYRPYDVSNNCAYSSALRYDLSFGMGLSDTITLVFHTLHPIDYDCQVEIVAESSDVFLIISILYPHNMDYSCYRNPTALTVYKTKDKCYKICDTIDAKNKKSPYFVTSVRERFKFHFWSNSSINLDMNAHMYQVTATAARMLSRREKRCYRKNESLCVNNEKRYCFTSGVVCDGIKNCGVADWFDERKAECGLPVEKLGFAPVFAVSAALLCAALAAWHVLTKFLPPRANSFFVFNANEDNRLRVDPVFTSPAACSRDIHRVQRTSLVPVSSESSSCDYSDVLTRHKLQQINQANFADGEEEKALQRTNTMHTMTAKLQQKLRAVTRSKSTNSPRPTASTSAKKNQVYDV
ncbi:uncharacterized protein LOC134803967 [Cydia splendana]|uniref:uncharacterized protein LOC134803967 n=1 Tax=Cydia splendana TaxID=1100963 RepID=UPI0028F47305